jgi:hypothetical protein
MGKLTIIRWHPIPPGYFESMSSQSSCRGYQGEQGEIRVSLDLPNDLERLPRDVELSLFRIVQECLTNLHRHSGSATAQVRLARARPEKSTWRCQPPRTDTRKKENRSGRGIPQGLLEQGTTA